MTPRHYVTLFPYQARPTASAGWKWRTVLRAGETLITAPVTATYDVGKDVASAVNQLSGGKLAQWGSWVGHEAGSGAKWLYDHDPVFQLGYKLATGENVWIALKETGTLTLGDVKIFGPYVAYIPGIGTAAGMALAAGVALASGKRLDEIAIEAARGAIPPGPALMAFDAANALVHGEGLEGAALDALKGELPEEAQGSIDAVIAIVKGGNVEEAVLGAVREALPPEAQVALDTGIAIAKGKKVADAIEDGVRGLLPPEYQAVFDAARDIANGQNVLEVAIQTARAELPPEAQSILDVGVTLAKGGSVQDVLIAAARAAIPSDYVQYFDLAMNLRNTDISGAVAAIKAQIPAGTPADQAYIMAKQAMGANASAATGATIATGGFASVGFSTVVNNALEAAIATARAQLPADPIVQSAFDAGVQIVRGRSLEDIAAAVAADAVPDQYQDALKKGVAATKAVVNGDNLGDVAYKTFHDQLPQEAQGYAELGLGLVKGEKSINAALAAAKAAMPQELMGAYDAVMQLASPDAPFRDQLATDVKAQITPGQSLQDAQAQASDLASRLIPAQPFDDARASLPSPTLQTAFDGLLKLAKAKIAGDLSADIVKGWIPDSFKDVYQKAASIADHANPSDVAIAVMRSQVPMKVQHAIDGASAVFKGKAPEEIANDPYITDAIARVMAQKRANGEIPPLLSDLTKETVHSAAANNIANMRNSLMASMTTRVGGLSNLGTLTINETATQGSNLSGVRHDIVAAASALDLDTAKFDQTIQTIANRRVALGAGNPYKGPAFDPGFEKILNDEIQKKLAAAAAKKASSQMLVGGSTSYGWMIPVAAIAVAGGAYYWMKKHPRNGKKS